MAPLNPLDVELDLPTMKRRSLHGASTTFLSQFAKFGLQFAAQIVLARLLDPAQYGLVALAAPILGFVQTLNDLGLGQAIIQKPQITQAQVSSLFWINVALSLILSAAVVGLAPGVAWLYGEPRLQAVTVTLGCLIFVTALSLQPTSLLSRQMRFVPLAIIDISCVFASAVVGITMAWRGFGYWSLVWMQVASSLTGLVLTWSFSGWRPSWPRRTPGLGPLIRFGAHLTGANLAGFFSSSADNIIVGLFAGTVQLGFYDRAYKLVAQPLQQIMTPVSRIAVPLLSRLVGTEETYRPTYLWMLQAMSLLCVPGLLCNIVFRYRIVTLLFGPQWAAASPIFGWICFGALAEPCYASAVWIFTTQGRTGQQMRVTVITSLINVASFALGVYWGALGVATVSALTFVFVQTPLMILTATREGSISARAIGATVIPIIGSACCSSVALYFLDRGARTTSLGTILASFVVSYLVYLIATAMTPTGRTFLRKTLNLRVILKRGSNGSSSPA